MTAVAGFKIVPPATPDDESIDLSIGSRGTRGKIHSPRIDAQLKSWRGTVIGDSFSYSLKIKNYNDLRDRNVMIPRILIVVVVPKDVDDWLSQSSEQIILRRCGYWISLAGQPEVENSSSKTLSIPATNLFSIEGLRGILSRVGNGEMP